MMQQRRHHRRARNVDNDVSTWILVIAFIPGVVLFAAVDYLLEQSGLWLAIILPMEALMIYVAWKLDRKWRR